jgi:hypothetical protein
MENTDISAAMVRKRTKPRISLNTVLAIIVLVTVAFSSITYKLISYDTAFTTLSPEAVIKIDLFLHSYPTYVGMQVMAMDLSKNSRYIVYSHLESNELQKLYMNYVSSRVSQISPIFTSNNEANNARMIRIINHEFVCSPFSESMLFKNLPLSGNYITTICAVSIPPSYGNFVGSVNLFLSKRPDDNETSMIKLHLKNISSEIFSEIH